MMECNDVLALNDEEILSYALDDEPLSKEKREHLSGCALCQQRVSQYQQLNTYLLSKLYRKQCPSATTLNYYCAHLLPPQQEQSINNHLHICPLCAREVESIKSTLTGFEPFSTSERDTA